MKDEKYLQEWAKGRNRLMDAVPFSCVGSLCIPTGPIL